MNTKQRNNTSFIVGNADNADSTNIVHTPTKEVRMMVNNLNITLKFAEEPNDHAQETILRVLIGSYKTRMAVQ